jgi:cell division protein FtsW
MNIAARALDVQAPDRAAPWAGRLLLILTAVLVSFGLLSVYSASSFVAEAEGLTDTHYLVEQAVRAAVGFGALFVARHLDYHLYRKLAWPLVLVSIFLLVIVILPWTEGIAPRINGARRWLDVGLTVQPSELAKFALIVWAAALAVKKQDRLDDFKMGVLPFLVVGGLLCGLVLLEPHFSAALILAALVGVIMYAAGARLVHFALLGALSLPLLWDQISSTGYRMNRITAFFHTEPGAREVGYQLHQSLIAVGSGGLFGVGYGESTQKLYYLPEPQNDFVFAIIAEEWGFVGAAVLILLFLGWILLGLRIARAAPDLFGRLLAVGITTLVAVSAFAHVGVTLGVLPTTGVNLPFVSAGGTHLVLVLGCTGVLLNIASQRG